jgi:predicted ArsR family transcriptional regulator
MLNSIEFVVAALSNILKETRSEILTCLKANGRMSVQDIAGCLGVSKVGLRRHLELLRSDGLVDFEVEHHDRGRPVHVYSLTSRAELFFPRSYDTFALSVLRQVGTVYGQAGVSKIICNQADELIASLKPLLQGLEFEERVRKLTEFLNQKGYAVSLIKQADGSYLAKQRNCPMIAVATQYAQVCDDEMRFYRELLETDVTRECRIASGAQSCDYRISRPGRLLR